MYKGELIPCRDPVNYINMTISYLKTAWISSNIII